SRRPEGKVGHPWQARETNVRQHLQATHCGVKQGAQYARSRALELTPKLALRAPVLLPNWLQRQKNAAVGQVAPADDVRDAVHQRGAGGLNQDLVIVGIELTHRKTAAARQATQRIRHPSW